MLPLVVAGLSLIPIGCEGDSLFQNDPMSEPDGGVRAEAPPMDADVAPIPDASVPAKDAEPQIIEPALKPVYIHTGSMLYSYDPTRNVAVAIGGFRTRDRVIEEMVDIAIDPDGRMFGGTRDQQVFRIDPKTASCLFAFDFQDELNGLTFLADGRLVVAGASVSIVDPTNGRMIRELVSPGTYETSGDIVGLPDGKLYWTVRGSGPGSTGDGLVRIHPSNGRVEFLGEASIDRIFGLGYAGDSLYGFSSSGTVATLDRQTGSVMRQSQLEGHWWGATTNPALWE